MSLAEKRYLGSIKTLVGVIKSVGEMAFTFCNSVFKLEYISPLEYFALKQMLYGFLILHLKNIFLGC